MQNKALTSLQKRTNDSAISASPQRVGTIWYTMCQARWEAASAN